MTLDPGTHKLSASAPGRAAYETTFEVPASGGSKTVEVPILAAENKAPETPVRVIDPPRGPPHPSGGFEKPLGITLIAVGGASLITAGIFGALTLMKEGERADCGESTPPEGPCRGEPVELARTKANEIRQDALNYQLVGIVTAAAGSALAITGGVLLLTAKEARAERAAIRPVFGPTSLGLAGRF